MDWSDVYPLDEATGVRVRAARAVAHEYSDGSVVEASILESIRTCRDVSSGSDELVRRIRDWPSEYHLSASRATLLAPFDLRGLVVLEVGSGCGAITRALGEAGARVVALEGSLDRARITAARCRGLDGVEIVCDDFRDFLPPAAFDAVLMVGVLEYAPSYFAGDDPVDAALAKARDCLTEHGALVVAIENQLGLKYFAGASEDHHGRAFFGIEDRYAETTGPRTFGRDELRRRLEEAGLAHHTWYYPFPDYKLPRLILTDESLRDPGLPVASLIGGLRTRDYVWPHPEIFAEDAAWEVVGRNGLVADLTNSFLVVASAYGGSALLKRPGWLAELRTTDRVRAYRTITRFVPASAGLSVTKVRADESGTEPAGAPVHLTLPERSPLLPGATLAARVRRLLRAPGTDAAALAAVLLPWVELLRSATLEGRGSALPGDLLDLLPRNLMEPPGRPLRATDPAGLTAFDLEWAYVPQLTVEHVLHRGLVSTLLEARGRAHLGAGMTTADLVSEVARRLEAPIGPDLTAELMEREAAIQSAVFGMDEQAARVALGARLSERFDAPPALDAAVGLRDARIRDLMEIVAERDGEISELERRAVDLETILAEQSEALERLSEQSEALAKLSAQIKAVEASSSWKLTAPLRRLRRRP